MALNLGDQAKDTITGFAGTVVAIHTYLNGCVRVSIQPNELKDGKPIDGVTFDVEQLIVTEAGKHKRLTPSGGPEKEPARTPIPAR